MKKAQRFFVRLFVILICTRRSSQIFRGQKERFEKASLSTGETLLIQLMLAR